MFFQPGTISTLFLKSGGLKLHLSSLTTVLSGGAWSLCSNYLNINVTYAFIKLIHSIRALLL